METKLKGIFLNLFKLRVEEITDSSSMANVRGWDSLKHMDLVLSIEEEFKIPPLTMDEIALMRNFAEIKKMLVKRGIS